MKSKKLVTYALLLASLAIWGVIAWRLVKAFKKEEVIVSATAPNRPTLSQPDSVMLLLNYDDPFLKDDTNASSPDEEDFDSYHEGYEMDYFQPEPEVVEGPAFRFKGTLKAGRETFGLLDSGGETLMVRAREKIGDFLVVSITPDKMVVRRQGMDIELFAE